MQPWASGVLLLSASSVLLMSRFCQAVEVLRGYSAFGDSRAVEVSDDMIQIGCEQIESGITTVVSLCTESRYVQMAEHAVRHIHDSSGYATLTLYRDLYVSMKWDGADANTVVYGSSQVSQGVG